MDIDSEQLGIPETDYSAVVRMPANEFQRICKDLSNIGDTGTAIIYKSWPPNLKVDLNALTFAVSISVTKDGIRFSTNGDIGSANVTIRQNNGVDVKVRVPCILCALQGLDD